MFDHIPVGVGSKGIIPMNARDLEEALEMGMDWSLREGYIWAEDKEHCEEYGRMLNADPSKVSMRAKKRGLPQVSDRRGTGSSKYCHGVGSIPARHELYRESKETRIFPNLSSGYWTSSIVILIACLP